METLDVAPDRVERLAADAVGAGGEPSRPALAALLADARDCFGRGDLREAQRHARDACRFYPQAASGYHALAAVDAVLGHTQRAIANEEQALAIDPGHAEAERNLRNLRKRWAVVAAILANHRSALAGDSVDTAADRADACLAVGRDLMRIEEAELAAAFFRRAIELREGFIAALVELGLANERGDRLRDAVECYRRAVAQDPDSAIAIGALIRALQDACLWDALARAYAHKAALLPRLDGRDAVRADRPFASLIASDDPAENRIAAERYATLLRERVGRPMKPARIRKHAARDRIAIGYLSSDFRYHPVGQLAAAILARHDRERFRIVAYSTGADDGSAERKAAERGAERFRDLRTATDPEIAAAIRDDRIDILVDLNGYTRGARSAAIAMRPAPVQAWLLGFPGTSGSDFVDYFISDRIALPPELARHFSEQPCWLPAGCQPLDDAQQISPAPATRAKLGLPEEGFLFVCWQAGFKIEPRAFDLWMDVLKTVPDSHLWLRRPSEFARDNLADRAARRGVDPARIVHAGRAAADKPTYLRHLACADLGLDTLIYNGHATTSDLLMAGVPVVTLPGRHTAGRVAASLLNAAGLPELVASSPRAYRDLAVKLARDPARLAALRARLAGNRNRAPLFDTTRYVRALESGYEAMQARRLAGAAPAPIAIGDAR